MAMRRPVAEWRPEVKNGGEPLGPVRLDGGEWDGFMSRGEVLAFAGRHDARVKVVGPLADYAQACEAAERKYLRTRLRELRARKAAR